MVENNSALLVSIYLGGVPKPHPPHHKTTRPRSLPVNPSTSHKRRNTTTSPKFLNQDVLPPAADRDRLSNYI